jgi:Skp family chaperone for outer membrane proteins
VVLINQENLEIKDMFSRQQFAVIVIAVGAFAMFGAVGLQGQEGSAGSGVKLAVVNVQTVFNTMDEKAAVEADIVQQAERLQKEEQDRQNAIRALQSDLDILAKDSAAYTQTRNTLEQKAIEFQAWKQYMQRKLESEKTIRTEGLYNNALAVVARLAEQNGYDLVLQKDDTSSMKAQNQQQLIALILSRKVLYSSAKLDITDQVIQICNNEFNNRAKG